MKSGPGGPGDNLKDRDIPPFLIGAAFFVVFVVLFAVVSVIIYHAFNPSC